MRCCSIQILTFFILVCAMKPFAEGRAQLNNDMRPKLIAFMSRKKNKMEASKEYLSSALASKASSIPHYYIHIILFFLLFLHILYSGRNVLHVDGILRMACRASDNKIEECIICKDNNNPPRTTLTTTTTTAATASTTLCTHLNEK